MPAAEASVMTNKQFPSIAPLELDTVNGAKGSLGGGIAGAAHKNNKKKSWHDKFEDLVRKWQEGRRYSGPAPGE